MLPVLPAAWLPWRVGSLRILKHVHEDGFKLAENHRGDLKVAFQALHSEPEVLRELGHVGPLPHLGEELDQTEEGTEQADVYMFKHKTMEDRLPLKLNWKCCNTLFKGFQFVNIHRLWSNFSTDNTEKSFTFCVICKEDTESESFLHHQSSKTR